MANDPQTYAELVDAVQRWTDDSTLTATIPEIIALSERRLSRRIVSPEMEGMTTITLTNGVGDMPVDLMQVRSFFIDYNGYRTPLNVVSEADFDLQYSTDTGRPLYYTIIGTSIYVWPLPDLAYTLSLRYKQMIPALSDDVTTNWLLAKWPDLYLAHALLVASDYGYDDSRLDWATTKAEQIIAEVNDAGRKLRYGDGPLVPRAPVGDYSISAYALRGN